MGSHKQLQIAGTTLEYLFHEQVYWTLSLEELVLVAEHTTNEGPYVDDYFLIFVTVQAQSLLFSSCSYYSEGRNSVLKHLAGKFGDPLEPGLRGAIAGVTEWNSRVIWPPPMAGKPYFTFTQAPPPDILEEVRGSAIGPAYERTVAAEVRDYLTVQLAARAQPRR